MRRVPRRMGGGLAVAIVIVAVIAIVLAVDSPASPNGPSNGSNSSGAVTVQRRNLVQTDTEAGTLSYADPQTVYNRLSGTITWLPSVGQVIVPGGTLYRVSGDPVILMNGSTPAYRDLSAADAAGPDILQLNRNLVRLGFNPEGIVIDDVWQPATTAAVEVFQESLGQQPTGILSLGQVVFLPGDQVVSALEASVGSTGGGSSSPSGSAAADRSPAGTSAEFVSLTTTAATKPGTGRAPTKAHPPKKSQGAKTISALLALLRSEAAQLKAETAELRAVQAASHSSPSSKPNAGSKSSGGGSSRSPGPSHSGGGSSGGGNSGSGSSGGSGSASAILQTSSTRLVAMVDLDASKQSEAKVGEKVTVEMPSGSTVNGTVTVVSSVAQTSSNSGNGNGSPGGGSGNGSGGNGSSSPTIPVTIALTGHLSGAGLDRAAVSVQFAQAEATNVLSVPVTALLATPGGGYAVQEAAAPHRLISVSTGLFAAGFVQISSPGIYPGLRVTNSQG